MKLKSLIAALVLAAGAMSTSAHAQMLKYVSIWEQPGDTAALDRWYRTSHSRESILFVGPWLKRYWAYRGYQVPDEAAAFNPIRYRLTEMWYDSPAARQEVNRAWYPLTPPPAELADPAKTRITEIWTRAVPDERYLDVWPRERADYMRWAFLMRYPTGVTREAGNAWFAQVRAPQIKAVPGVRRFVCFNSVDAPANPQAWVKLCEVWFDDYGAFKSAMITKPPAWTKPAWGAPGLGFELTSIFTSQAPDMDFLRDDYRTP